MARGHGMIVNLSNYLPFIFTFNPETVNTEKKINYTKQYNISALEQKKIPESYEPERISFELICIDMENPLGVTEEVKYFEALREPAPHWGQMLDFWSGKVQVPPPQVLYQFGVSLIPLVWNVDAVTISVSNFYDGHIRGVLGIPRRADISIHLSLDETSKLNQANWIAKKASEIAGSGESLINEIVRKAKRVKKDEMRGIGYYPKMGEDW